ncbi:uncharacterized protein ALTATR162_LOCUS12024 [Alternaria atra]|uniref:Uncharacterized protein n=1 Tax=Alternaria atra TaxID=119953 RepID=A0A8J2ICL0_9PLEO|nr:uncharacterized protein ALTATR162_LOCUS12024 [Alternaria atra]CAG5188750.1 unnamed protein product [Alternaria atra]
MPPKKSVGNGDAGENGGPFKWEGPNDTKLLLLTQGRWVKPDEYPQLSSAFPGMYHSPPHPVSPFLIPYISTFPPSHLFPIFRTSIGSIRNRISTLRVKQRDLYLELSWELPEGGAGHSAKKTAKTTPRKTASAKKRTADAIGDGFGDEGENGEEIETPSKKPRARKGKKENLGEGWEEEMVEDESGVEEDYIPMAQRVKEEVIEEMV